MHRAIAAVALLLFAACGGGGGGDHSACGPVRRERLDPSSAVHLLPGAPAPEYRSDPPTSGAHSSARPPAGALRASLSRPDQVAVLETGAVLVQYRDLEPDQRRRLEDLAGEGVTVAPNGDLPARVVATAWTVKLECSRVELDALRGFVRDHRGTSLHQ